MPYGPDDIAGGMDSEQPQSLEPATAPAVPSKITNSITYINCGKGLPNKIEIIGKALTIDEAQSMLSAFTGSREIEVVNVEHVQRSL